MLKNAADIQAVPRAASLRNGSPQHQAKSAGFATARCSAPFPRDDCRSTANARRRKHEARYDDGVARLYRAIESLAQLALAERHEIQSTDRVPLERIPESIRGHWALRAEDGKLLLGLQDAFALLDEFGDPMGRNLKRLDYMIPNALPWQLVTSPSSHMGSNP